MKTRFGIRIPPCERLSDVADAVKAAEDAGFDVAWLPDSHFLWRDVWAAMALAAERTSRIRLGTCVTNFETRHPSVTASAAASIDELAPGRVILGVGSGDSAVKTIGHRPTRLAAMRDHLVIVKALLAGEEVGFEGRRMRLRHAPRNSVPVYMAANGPKALGLAGELCEGILTLVGITPTQIDAARSHVALGASRVNRSLDEVDICMGVHCEVGSDDLTARRLIKPLVVATAQTGGKPALEAIGIHIDPPAVVGGIYPDVGHAEDWAAAAQACEQWVTDTDAQVFADTFCAVGVIDTCRRQLQTAIDAGADSFYLRHLGSYTLPHDLINAFGPLAGDHSVSTAR